MRSGRTYEVFMNAKPVGYVGSTICTLKQRRKWHVKRFGPTVELRLIREVPRPEGYSDSDYNFYLKACEAMDIARKKTYTEHGGLNKISPLIQALGHPMLEMEIGRIGGRIGGPIGGRRAVDSGQLASILELPQTKRAQHISGSILGRKNIESGHLARICDKGGYVQGRKNAESGQIQAIGRTQGRKAVESGHLARIAVLGGREGGRKNVESGRLANIRAKGNCQRWNINRGKPCVCGKHLPSYNRSLK